jgi:anti-sigma B factor antagonist
MKINPHEDTLSITGVTELTATTARDVKSKVKGYFGKDLVNIDFDASGITFLDSSGLGTLISLLKLAQERGGQFRLISPPPAALQVIELTRLHRVFNIDS